jgi:hypothetical protein
VPTTPNPTGGYFVMLRRADCIELDMSVDEALTYIMVNTASSQSFVETALEEYHKAVRGYGPVVIVRAGVSVPEIPADVIKSLEGLKGYPRLIATDPDDNKVIASVPYLTLEDRDDGIKAARRSVHKYLGDKKKQPRVPPTPIPAG